MELTLQPESLNRWGTAHGGILFALADIAAGTAVLTLRQEVCLTVNASIDFLDAAGLGSTLTPWATWTVWASLSASATRTITDETGRLLATLRTVMDLTGRPLEL